MDKTILSKKCTGCKKEKTFDNFSKHKLCKYGLSPKCKVCKAKEDSLYAANNKEKVTLKKTLWANNNKEKIKLAKTKWQKNNASYGAFTTAKYRYAKIKATPNWADYNLISIEYELAAWCTKVMGEVYHVDHIIPLQGKNVCGLHVHNNLQVLRRCENISKNNKFDIK